MEALPKLVPAPLAGEQDYFLCVDGTWKEPTKTDRFLCSKGYWTEGNERDSFLKGDGTWSNIEFVEPLPEPKSIYVYAIQYTISGPFFKDDGIRLHFSHENGLSFTDRLLGSATWDPLIDNTLQEVIDSLANSYREINYDTIRQITSDTIVAPSSLENVFARYKNLEDISGLANWNTRLVQNLSNTFASTSSLLDISSLSHWDVSSVINMDRTFDQCACTDFSPIDNWKIANIVNHEGTFRNCTGRLPKWADDTWM